MIVSLGAAPGTSAALLTGVSVTASSTIGGNRVASRVVDTGGTNATDGFKNIDADPEFEAQAYLDANWLSNTNGVPATLTFDLGGRYALDLAKVWNYNDTDGNALFVGTKKMQVFVSDGGVSYSQVGGDVLLSIAPGINNYDTPDSVSLGAAAATHVRFDLVENHGFGFGLIGLGQAQFFGDPAPIPEPATAALAIGAITIAALSQARRR